MNHLPTVPNEVILAPTKKSFSPFLREWWHGDMHVHSAASTRPGTHGFDGLYAIEEIAAYYRGLGLDFVCFTEHASPPAHPRILAAVDEICVSLVDQAATIAQFNLSRRLPIMLFSGAEASMVIADGKASLDVPDSVLKQLDIAVASRHALPLEHEKDLNWIYRALNAAIGNPLVAIIGHPDRYLSESDFPAAEYWQFWDEIIDGMKKAYTAFEINLNSPPNPHLLQKAAKAGLIFSLGFDAHEFTQFRQTATQGDTNKLKDRWAKGSASLQDISRIIKYKAEQLALPPGIKPQLMLFRAIRSLQSLGVRPERVLNSSCQRTARFLQDHRPDPTFNLKRGPTQS